MKPPCRTPPAPLADDIANWQAYVEQVTPLTHAASASPLTTTPPLPTVIQHRPSAAPREETWGSPPSQELHHFRQAGVRHAVWRQLGRLAVQEEMDLHGLTRAQALSALQQFLARAQSRHLRCVQIIHGKGHHSEASIPILKPLVRAWLSEQLIVRAFIDRQAGGAVKVLLSD